MVNVVLEGVIVTPLKKIAHPKGNVLHALKASDSGFFSFGEAYFSCVNENETKGWKKHTKMILNIIVPVGTIQFCLHDDRPDSSTFQQSQTLVLSPENYHRLTVPAGIWMAFRGKDADNLLLNIASIEHDPLESINLANEAMIFSEV